MVKRSRPPGLMDTVPEVEGSKTYETATSIKKSSTPHGAVVHQSGKNRKVEASVVTRMGRPKQAKSTKDIVKPTRNVIHVGVDYGTTFSGLAYVWGVLSDARDVAVVTEWPGGVRKNEVLEKVPTKYAYASENEGLEEDAWGYEVDSTMKSYSFTKMMLDENSTTTEFDHPGLQAKVGNGLMKVPAGKTAQDVAADYMRCLRKHVIEKLDKVNGKAVMKVTPIHFWLTHPATWSDGAVNATLQAAKQAGFATRPQDEISMITEPEAAAMAILSGAIEKNKALYKVGTNVLVADLGGGTLDMQCLKLTSIDPLKTDEACRGEGGKSGTFYIDLNLHEWCENTFGDAFKELPPSKTAAGSPFMDDFEVIRKTFNGKNHKKTFRLRLPALGKDPRAAGFSTTSYDFEDGDVLLGGAAVQEMFEPVIEKAIALIKAQLQYLAEEDEPPFRVLVLCGGLGNSEYVFTRLLEFCNEFLEGEVELVTDNRAWSAVVRGAAIRGLEGSIVYNKKAKRSYGLGIHRAFREGIDKEEDSFECPCEGKRADGYVDFGLLKKNAKITPNMKSRISTYLPIYPDMEDEELIFIWDLYSCQPDVAQYARVDDFGVQRIKKFKLDLREYYRKNKRLKATELSARAVPEKVPINIVLQASTERGVLDVRALVNRTSVGTAKIEYGKDNQRPGARSAGAI